MDGIRVIASFNTPEADPLLRFGLRIPQGAQILFHDDGTGEVSNSDGTFIGAIGTAWAVDAEGKEVPTWYEYENGELYQYVDHLSGDFAYPIIADPAFVVPLIIHGGRIIFQRVIAPALISAGRIAVQQLAKKGIKAVVTGLRSFTRTNARHNLIVSSRRNPGGRCEAHHTLPVKFSPRFEKAGFRGSDSIHHPKYLVWWEKNDHRSKAAAVNRSWQSWFNRYPNPSKRAVLDKRTAVLRQYPPRC